MADKRKEILAELSEDELREMVDTSGAGIDDLITSLLSKSLCPTTSCTPPCGR